MIQSNVSNWQPPDGLGYSSLRPVRLSAQGKILVGLGVFFALGGPALGIFISTQIRHDRQRDQLLIDQGTNATATVERVWRTGGKSEKHMVSYRFSAGGQEMIGSSSMQRDRWKQLHEGDSIAIRYAPLNPEINRPAEGARDPAPLWVPWFTAAMFLWPAILFWAMIRRQSQLLSEGRPAPATVTKIRRAKQYIVYFEFQLPSGEVRKGRSTLGRRTNLPAEGSQVTVLYLPDSPKRNSVYPLELVTLDRN